MNTIAFSTQTPGNTRDFAARMAAAARTAREREAREAQAERALRLDEAEFGTFPRVGLKVIDDHSKYRYSVARKDAAATIARHWADNDEVEFWGYTPDPEEW